MRIAIAIERYDPAASNIERATGQIASQLIARGHEVTVVAGLAPPTQTLQGGVILNGHTEDFRHRVSVKRFARWAPGALKTVGADVTLSMTLSCPAMVVLPHEGTLAQRAIQEKQAVESREPLPQRVLRRLSMLADSALARERVVASDAAIWRFVAISQEVARQLKTHHAVAQERIQIIRSGVDVACMTRENREAARSLIRSGFGVPDDSTAILFHTHRDEILMGIHPLLRAAKELVALRRNIVLLLAGHIGFQVHSAIAQAGLRDHVRMIGPTTKTADLLAASDMTVMPSHFDPAGLLAVESLQMDVPVVTTRNSGASDWMITQGGMVGGRVIDNAGDTASLTRAIDELLHPHARQQTMQAFKDVGNDLSMKRHVDALEGLLTEAAAR